MRLVTITILLAAALAAAPAAQAQEDPQRPQVSSRQCNLSTPYNVLVDTGGVWLYRTEGVPQVVRIFNGTLAVDHREQAIGAADAARLRRIEAEAHALMPEVAALAGETVEVTFDALAAAIEIVTGSKRKARRIASHRKAALAHVDGTLGKGRWDQDLFDERFQANIEAAAEAMAGSMARSVLWSVFTGRAGRIERRAERMEAELEARIEARTAAIEAQAEAMCDRIDGLYALQAALDYRLDGRPLRLLEPANDADAVAALDESGG